MTRLIIFDLDGTLVDAYPAVVASVNFTLEQLGFKKRSALAIKRAVGWGDRQLMANLVGDENADAALKIYRPHHIRALQNKNQVRFLAGVRAALLRFKTQGLKLAIATNRPSVFTKVILKGLKASEYFDYVLCADQASKPKPAPDMLWMIARRLKVKHEDILYVGDMTIDIQTAHAAGIRVVAVTGGSSTVAELKSLKPQGIIHKIEHLRQYLT